MAMIERIEKLRQLERMLGEIRGLCGCDTSVDDVGRFRRGLPEFPELVATIAG
jgi:hypothetical protein